MADDRSTPLSRRVPGAGGAAPSASEQPMLPELLLQNGQGAVDAAHAEEAAREQEQVAEHGATRVGAVRFSAGAGLFARAWP